MQRRITILLSLTVALLSACAEEHASYLARSDDDHPGAGVSADGGRDAGASVGRSQVNPGAEPSNSAFTPNLDAGASVETLAPGVSCANLVCDVFATCEGEKEPRCTCAQGLEGDGQRCADIDECQQAEPACAAHATCRNTFGSYSCDCNQGYVRDGDGCVADAACADSPCAPSATCSEVAGALTCECEAGSFGNGFRCTAQDACADEPCGEGGVCTTVAGQEPGYTCACKLGFFGVTECSACGSVLELYDPELERAVRQQLGRSDEDSGLISLLELSEHTTLNASDFGVRSLEGLECWSTLQVLDLSYNDELTTDAAQALASLTQLTELRLDCSQVTDLSYLLGHPRLQVLRANVLNCAESVPLNDVALLGSLPRLEVLDLRGQKLSDASFLAELRNLRSLWLGYNELNSLDDFARLPLLRELDLSYNQISSVDALDRFPRLEYLNVTGNHLTSLQATAELPQLRELSASENRLRSLPDWQSSSELRELNVSYNQVTSAESLENLSQVTWVNLAGNALATLAPLLGGTLRGTLVVAGNPLPCETARAQIGELRGLGIDVQGECVE
jgi:Calcium-binding EGF domain/Leucine rich repeat/EGF-like domain/Leucine Rich repeat